MKKLLFVLVLSIFIFSSCSLFSKNDRITVKKDINKEEKTVTMVFSKNKLDPEKIEINLNDSVIFFNEDDQIHQVVIGDQGGIPLQTGQSWTYKFESSGEFDVYDVLDKKVRGKVVVR